MQFRNVVTVTLGLVVLGAVVLTTPETEEPVEPPAESSGPEVVEADEPGGPPPPAREILAADDGAGGTTIGGATAVPEQVFTVTSRTELITALGGDNAGNSLEDTPKIVMVDGVIDLREDTTGASLPCTAFESGGFSYDEYLDAVEPAVFGRDAAPSGPLEDQRQASETVQRDFTTLNVGSNTTLLGLDGAQLQGGTVNLEGVDNVILRNLEVTAGPNCFPRWDGTAGEQGEFQPGVDAITVLGSDRLWIDHNRLEADDPELVDTTIEDRFEVPFATVDGLLDIVFGSTDITVSHNDFALHDSALLIGSDDVIGSDDDGTDGDALQVSVHHNRFAVAQDAPEVRFGDVDVFNNLYLTDVDDYASSFGVGVGSRMLLENNLVLAGASQPLGGIIAAAGGTEVAERGTLVRRGDTAAPEEVDLLTEHNTAGDVDLGPGAGFEPGRRLGLDPTAEVQAIVEDDVGPGLVE